MITNSNLICVCVCVCTIYDGLGGLFDLDEARAEVPNDGEADVTAKPRDIHTANLASL